jgi:hypothetical protein
MRLILLAAIIGGALVSANSYAMALCARASIPLPSRTLLAAPAEIDCTSKTSSLGALDQASGPTDSAANEALRMKLDYERQCYRQAGTNLRDSLRLLQAAIEATMKSLKRDCPVITLGAAAGPGSSFPLPSRALLTPPPEVNCEFKTGDGAGGPGPDASPARRDDFAPRPAGAPSRGERNHQGHGPRQVARCPAAPAR